MLFDWAAQPFFTLVTTFIFGPYFVSRLAEDPAQGQAVWTYGIAAAGLVIAILSPILGSIADQTGPRKPWIAFFAVIKIAALLTLWIAEPGANLFLIVTIFALAMVHAVSDGLTIAYHGLNLGRVALCANAAGTMRMVWVAPSPRYSMKTPSAGMSVGLVVV